MPVETAPMIVGAPGLSDEFINEATGFESVESPNRFAKPVLSEGLDLIFVELVLLDDLNDEVALL